jgi:hypothetical protein
MGRGGAVTAMTNPRAGFKRGLPRWGGVSGLGGNFLVRPVLRLTRDLGDGSL